MQAAPSLAFEPQFPPPEIQLSGLIRLDPTSSGRSPLATPHEPEPITHEGVKVFYVFTCLLSSAPQQNGSYTKTGAWPNGVHCFLPSAENQHLKPRLAHAALSMYLCVCISPYVVQHE